jgi:hypothetical protein
MGYVMWWSLPGTLLDRILRGEARLYQGMLIRCQSYCIDYACSFGGVVVSHGDETSSSSQVPVIRRMWAPVAMSYHARHLMLPIPEVLALVVPTRYRKPPGEAVGSSRTSQTRGQGLSGLTAGEILSVHDYRDEGVCQCGMLPGLVLLSWWSLLFSKEWRVHIWYEVYGSLAVFHWREPVVSRSLGYNQRSTVPEVLDPEKIDLELLAPLDPS